MYSKGRVLEVERLGTVSSATNTRLEALVFLWCCTRTRFGRVMFSTVEEELEMNTLLEMCSGSKLVVNDGKYRGMRLLMPGDTKPIHTRVIVSAMHKLMRQKRSAELVYLLGCFYVAVWNDPGDPQVAQMKLKLTCVSNRFAVCVFEEGCMLLINERAQRAVVRFCVSFARFVCLLSACAPDFPLVFLHLQVTELITMEKVRIASNWPAVIKHILRIVSILHYAQRGRIISLVKSHALLRNPTFTSVCPLPTRPTLGRDVNSSAMDIIYGQV